MPDDHMITKLDLEYFSRLTHLPCDPLIGLGWLRFSRRMVVHHDDAKRSGSHGQAKDFARMGGSFVQASDGNQMMADHLEPRIEEDDRETFHMGIVMRGSSDVLVPVIHDPLRSGNLAQAVGVWAFAHGHDFPFSEPSLSGHIIFVERFI